MESLGISVRQVDVLVCGGGPVGLITAFQLLKFNSSLSPTSSPVSVAIIEKHTKSTQDSYGRAVTLFPRTTEMLDQLSVADELAQSCFACRTTVNYDKDGKEVEGRGWSFMEEMGKDVWTQWDFALVLRQKYQEGIFRERLRELGGNLETQRELVSVEVDEGGRGGGYRVMATIRNCESGTEEVIMCRYLIGADGGRSFVRRALEVPFEGSTTEDRWVRIDGIVETDMPKSRGYGAIESPTHGSVLWAALDHGATRIGFAFTAERQRKHEVFHEEAAVAEAIEAVKPFKLKFKQVDWFTVYSVGQRIAKTFSVFGCVFLAGDSAHTHSSGAAQGMNAGIHDSVNLGWKLFMVLKQLAPPSLLDTYESERLPNVQKLINYDKDISRLMTMQLPSDWKGDPAADPNEILGVVMAEASAFTSGLNISLSSNCLNFVGSFKSAINPAPVREGQRAPDAQLQKPGSFESTRIHKETPNNAKFSIVVFAGDPEHTSDGLKAFTRAINTSKILWKLPTSWLTISVKRGPSPFELLGVMPLGKVLYDEKQIAHLRYGVGVKEGAVFVQRPDGWIGTATVLQASAVEELELYFKRVLCGY